MTKVERLKTAQWFCEKAREMLAGLFAVPVEAISIVVNVAPASNDAELISAAAALAEKRCIGRHVLGDENTAAVCLWFEPRYLAETKRPAPVSAFRWIQSFVGDWHED